MAEISLIERPGPEIEAAILAPLLAYNERNAPPHRWAPLAVVIRDHPEGPVTGGLWGACFYDWLHIRLVVVPEALRGQGLGARLMQQAEEYARGRGAIGVLLDTFSFQARGFYEKLGFSCFGAVADHPLGGARFFMQKRLSEAAGSDPRPLAGRS